MATIILEQSYFSGDGDPGLMISDAQKLLFPESFLSGTPLDATLEDQNNIGVFKPTILSGGLIDRHPWDNAYWLLYFTPVSFDPRPLDVLQFTFDNFWTNLINTIQT